MKLEEIEGKQVIKLEIPPSPIPVSYNGRFYIRSGSTKQELKGIELLRFLMKKQNISWDSLTLDAGIEEIDGEILQLFVDMAKDRLFVSRVDSLERILENLELVKDGKLTNAAVLLFGKNPQKYFKNARVMVGRFKTTEDIIDSVEIDGNLFKQIEETMKILKKHMNVRYEIKGLRREDIWDYPVQALREALINALVHRDYMSPDSIQIRVYDDHIWFWNPGGSRRG
ncbi:MAG: AlbA family DNA-binding domain-containing protein [Candidatus Syntropharchaeia archaeon]